MKVNQNKKNSIALFLALISGLLMFVCLFCYTWKNENIVMINITASEYMNYYYISHHRFDYFHGLWLIFAGIFISMLMVFLEIPSPDEILEYIVKKIKKS